MQKLYTLACALLVISRLSAQSVLKVESGTDLTVKAGTSFYAGGLVLQPSIDFSFSNNELTRSGSVSHYTNNNYASRVISWQQQAPAYTGSFRFYYSDDVLNGIPENSLVLNVHNGSYWEYLSSLLREPTENYVETAAVAGLKFSEFALSDELHTLPLIWGPVQAVRNNSHVTVNFATFQEQQVNGFVVERSIDNRIWLPVSDLISARNQAGEQHYSHNDLQAPASRLYYRIRQQDLDGSYHYSTVVTLAAPGEKLSLVLFPNPASEGFRLLNADAGLINQVSLYSVSGQQLISWNKSVNNWYSTSGLAAGRYHVRIVFNTGEIQQLSFIKK